MKVHPLVLQMTIYVIASPRKPLDFGVLEPSVLLLVLTFTRHT